jgi:2-dehydro-3-deoxyglucarate aldolase/4-hydroxy-2-oxoheptanedioate aldolase
MSHSIPDLLAAGKTVRVMSLGAFAQPKLVEIAAHHQMVHGFWIDQEHAAVSHQQLELLLLACRATGLDAFARVPPVDYATIMRPMEAGCCGIMAAQIRTMEQVQQVVAWSKYPPEGVRGLFMGNAECNYGKADAAMHVAAANRRRWLAIQIETAEAVELVEKIAANDGVDHLFVGPADLACTLGVPGDVMHQRCLAALEQVAAAAERNGKTWGALSRSLDHIRVCRDLGCRLFSVYGDLDVIHRGIASMRGDLDDLLPV